MDLFVVVVEVLRATGLVKRVLVSNLVFYAESTSTVMSGREVFGKRKIFIFFFFFFFFNDRSRMTDRNKELVPDSWSLAGENALTTGPFRHHVL